MPRSGAAKLVFMTGSIPERGMVVAPHAPAPRRLMRRDERHHLRAAHQQSRSAQKGGPPEAVISNVIRCIGRRFGPPLSFRLGCRAMVLRHGLPDYAAIALFKFSSTLSRKPVVESHFWSA